MLATTTPVMKKSKGLLEGRVRVRGRGRGRGRGRVRGRGRGRGRGVAKPAGLLVTSAKQVVGK